MSFTKRKSFVYEEAMARLPRKEGKDAKRVRATRRNLSATSDPTLRETKCLQTKRYTQKFPTVPQRPFASSSATASSLAPVHVSSSSSSSSSSSPLSRSVGSTPSASTRVQGSVRPFRALKNSGLGSALASVPTKNLLLLNQEGGPSASIISDPAAKANRLIEERDNKKRRFEKFGTILPQDSYNEEYVENRRGNYVRVVYVDYTDRIPVIDKFWSFRSQFPTVFRYHTPETNEPVDAAELAESWRAKSFHAPPFLSEVEEQQQQQQQQQQIEKDVLCCWHCTYPIPSPEKVVTCPYKFNEKTKAFTVIGYFCNWACAAAWGRTDLHDVRGRNEVLWHIRTIVCEAVREAVFELADGFEEEEAEFDRTNEFTEDGFAIPFYETRDSIEMRAVRVKVRQAELLTHANQITRDIRIRPAPSRYTLRKFGGPLSIEEFRDQCEQSYSLTSIMSNLHRTTFEPANFGVFSQNYRKLCLTNLCKTKRRTAQLTRIGNVEPYDSTKEAAKRVPTPTETVTVDKNLKKTYDVTVCRAHRKRRYLAPNQQQQQQQHQQHPNKKPRTTLTPTPAPSPIPQLSTPASFARVVSGSNKTLAKMLSSGNVSVSFGSSHRRQ